MTEPAGGWKSDHPRPGSNSRAITFWHTQTTQNAVISAQRTTVPALIGNAMTKTGSRMTAIGHRLDRHELSSRGKAQRVET